MNYCKYSCICDCDTYRHLVENDSEYSYQLNQMYFFNNRVDKLLRCPVFFVYFMRNDTYFKLFFFGHQCLLVPVFRLHTLSFDFFYCQYEGVVNMKTDEYVNMKTLVNI